MVPPVAARPDILTTFSQESEQARAHETANSTQASLLVARVLACANHTDARRRWPDAHVKRKMTQDVIFGKCLRLLWHLCGFLFRAQTYRRT
jgi:hypothetical protein